MHPCTSHAPHAPRTHPGRHRPTAVLLARLGAARSRAEGRRGARVRPCCPRRPLTRVRGDHKGCSAPASSPARRWLCVGAGATGSLVSSPGIPGQRGREVVRNALERQSGNVPQRCSRGCPPPMQSLCGSSAESSSALNSQTKYTQQHTGARQHCQVMFILHFKPP